MPSNSAEITGNIPQHVAIIMDGNGRWAQARGLPRLAGHKAGTENLREIIRASIAFGIEDSFHICLFDGELDAFQGRGQWLDALVE